MRLTVALVSISCVLAAGGPARAQERKDLNVAFQEALDAVLAGNGEVATAAFSDLVDHRWEELSPRGRHGASTLLMFALLLEDRQEDACARGAALFGAMPEVFYPLGKEGAPEVARALSVLSVRAGKNTSLLYVHNRSDKDVTIEGTRYELSYGYKTSSTSVGGMTTDGSPAFPRPLVLAAGRGTIVGSPEGGGGGLFGMAVADVVCVLAAQANTTQPDWMHLTMDSYSQTLERLRIVAGKVLWGAEALEGLVLVDFTAERPAEGEAGGGGGE